MIKNSCDQSKYPSTSELLQPSSNDGNPRVISQRSGQSGIIEDLVSQALFNQQIPRQSFATHTAESVRPNKTKILNDKSKASNKRIRITKPSQTSGRGLTSDGKVCFDWWISSCKDASKKLWSPIEIGSVGSDSNSSNTYVKETKHVSSFKMRISRPQNRSSQKILWPSYMSSVADITGCGDTDKKENVLPLTRCRKVRMRPQPHQAQILRKWMKAARWTYNKALRLVLEGKRKANLGLNKWVVTSRETDSTSIREMKQTVPADIRKQAVKDLVDAHTSSWASYRALKKINPKARPPTFEYKSSKLVSDSFGCEFKSVKIVDNQLYLFSTLKKFNMREPIRLSEAPRVDVKMSCRIQYVHGRWFILIPYQTTSGPPKVAHDTQGRLGAYDPGIRTFVTTFTEDETREIGIDMDKVCDKLNKKITSLENRIQSTSVDPGKRKRLRKALREARLKCRNVIDDFHWKTIRILLDIFDVLVAPRLRVQVFLGKDSRLDPVSKARLKILRHGLFRIRLLMKAETLGKEIYDLRETGTSRTCSSCGAENQVGSAKTFKCFNCNLILDRDINAAKNHVLKFLVERTGFRSCP